MRDVEIGAADADPAGSHLKSLRIMRKTVDIVTVLEEIITEVSYMSNWCVYSVQVAVVNRRSTKVHAPLFPLLIIMKNSYLRTKDEYKKRRSSR